jgi:hypothetical protein
MKSAVAVRRNDSGDWSVMDADAVAATMGVGI